MRPTPRLAAAMLAAMVIAFLPSCAFDGRTASMHEHAAPIERPHIVRRVAPRDPDLPARIERQAGEFCPPELEAELWYLFLFYGLFYVGYALVWGMVELVELIVDACEGNPPTE